MIMTKDLRDRLGALRVEMPATTAEMHLAAIERELAHPVVVRNVRHVRRLVAALAASLTLLLPAAAIAADDAVPGDVLYPVKRSVEWAWSLVDSEVVVRHRLDELETVIDSGGPAAEIRARLEDAEAVIEDASPTLVRRLERITARLGGETGADERPVPGGPGGQSSGPSSGGADGDRVTTQTTVAGSSVDTGSGSVIGPPEDEGHPEGGGSRSGSQQEREDRPGQG